MLLKKELQELERLLPQATQLNTEVSNKRVDWHIDHSLKVIIGICKMLKKSDSKDYKWKFNFPKLLVFTTGVIPRGKGKAPKSVIPPDKIKTEDILHHLEEAKQQLNTIASLPAKSHFEHPYFGNLNLKDSKKFLGIHTNHHLKIIRDIVK